MNSTQDSLVAQYADAVRRHLSDLPADELVEIMEDVTGHLDEVRRELGVHASVEALEARLGTPAGYAEELRAAAGLGAAPGSRPDEPMRLRAIRFLVTWAMRVAVGVTVVGGFISLVDGYVYPEFALATAVIVAAALGLWLGVRGPHRDPAEVLRELPDVVRVERWWGKALARPWGRPTGEFVRSLRPAWWVVRGWAAAQIIVLLSGGSAGFPVDRSAGALIVLVAAVAASVWWGRRYAGQQLPAWPRLAQLAGNTALAIAAPLVLFASGQPQYYEMVHTEPAFDGFYHQDGSPIENLFVYGPDGQLIDGARIYDQDGRPVENVHPMMWEYGCESGAVVTAANSFPRPFFEYHDVTGRCVEVEVDPPFGPNLPGSATK